ncbi:MAG: type 2 isopentenyl-diphosphate Delta-isomerase [Firmicutes bacterium]|nr:type 2 isopentenyl-diphosphate Delta-isomerase [Bacillota bacterium]
MAQPQHRRTAGFDDVLLLPCALSGVAWANVDLSTSVCGYTLESPLVINAMTGGAPETLAINRELARAARRHGLAMAVGSQTAALRDAAVAATYAVVREEHPDGVIIANVGMGTEARDAQRAVDMIAADALQVHLNVAQELFMPEGDRDFSEALRMFGETARTVAVPVIAKEVGQGIVGPSALQAVAAGAAAIDVGGRGGTSFIEVEARRAGRQLSDDWASWGASTAFALCDCAALRPVTAVFDLIASGGIRTGHDVAKALALGARAVGIAGPFLRAALSSDPQAALDDLIEDLHWSLRALCVLTGAESVAALSEQPVLITGPLRELLQARGHEDWLLRLGRGMRA